jgi:uncharacterized protein (TIGR03067 family)
MDMSKKLCMVLTLWASCAFASDPIDVTGTWQITKATVRGKDIDVSEFGNYTAVVDKTTWVDVEGQRKTTYHYGAVAVAKQTRLKLCHDAELQKIEALAIVRMKGDVLEVCMIDYSPHIDYPTAFESTEKNRCKLFRFERKKRATKE